MTEKVLRLLLFVLICFYLFYSRYSRVPEVTILAKGEMEAFLKKKDCVKDLREMIARDSSDKLTEYGGFVYLDKKKNEPKLKFVLVESINHRLAKSLIACGENVGKIEKNLDDNISVYKYLFDKSWYKQYKKMKNKKGEMRNRLLLVLAKSHLSVFDERYITERNTEFKMHYQGLYKTGEFLGTFHLHTSPEPPSNYDLEINKEHYKLRSFVVVNRINHISIHVLEDGKMIEHYYLDYQL